MQRDEALIHHHPVGVEGPLYQEVSQGRDGDIRLVCTLKQIWKHDDNVILFFDLASHGTYSQDVSSWVQWSPQWLPCTPPWPGPDLPDCVAPPGSCHWESVLLESASLSGRYLSFLTDLKLNTVCLLMTERGQHRAQGQVRYFVLCVSTVSWDTVLPGACCCWLCWWLGSLASTGQAGWGREGEPVPQLLPILCIWLYSWLYWL